MPEYKLPGVYLGTSPDAEKLYNLVHDINELTGGRFRSVNGFVKWAIAFAITHDPDLKKLRP